MFFHPTMGGHKVGDQRLVWEKNFVNSHRGCLNDELGHFLSHLLLFVSYRTIVKMVSE